MRKMTITFVIPILGDWSQNALFVTEVQFFGVYFWGNNFPLYGQLGL